MLHVFVVVLVLSTAAGQFNIFTPLKSFSRTITREVSALTVPVERTVMTVGFSQCKNVKRLLGVDYDSYNNTHSEPDLSKIRINFITRNKKISYKLTTAAIMIPNSEWFNMQYPLKIYLHGFIDNPKQGSFSTLSQAFLDMGDFNIVALDASSLIRWLYFRSTTMVHFIGQELGKLLAALVQAGLPPSYIHLIGHSLGSHISGFAGQTFTSLTGHRVGRITGLDPAGPCFSNVDETLRLNVNHADFVEAIHTDAGVYGIWKQVGHADFYPNSGSQQPGCLLSFAACSHSRAWIIYAESVRNPQAFVGVRCPDWRAFRNGTCYHNDRSLMGYGCAPDARGAYYLRTNDESPYGLGDHGVVWVNDDGLVKNLQTSIFNVMGDI